ncbi:hypothetical protein NC652_008323 [Populus alba x Populus x berolinensis]|uniref:Acyl-coenzyme A thioesterase 13 n=1 Tax=Populus tomentosa TaxID=118781 RepID=A0A8X8A893_POPTO|nr:hypothetical protein POTOM_011563 [Populus tomentosa]KAJ6942468.1 hypothetical protein NC652_008323 [Populus alba x Populus x berolinensis]
MKTGAISFNSKEREMEDNPVQSSNRWLEDLSNGLGHQLEAITLEGLKIVKAHKGFALCNFFVSNRISDADGNWHVGAMATLIDDVGAAAIYSYGGHIKASVDLNISFLSTAKIQEEVEVEAKVVGDKGRITSVLVEVRRKSNGELIALGKQWMASHNNSNKASKL